MFDLGGTVAAHDCNCRCYLEYNLMTAEEFAKVTGKKVANDGNSDIIEVETKVDYMSNSFRPKYGKETVDSVGNINIYVKKVENSQFELYTDVANTIKNKAVRLTEKNMREVAQMMPTNFEIPKICVIDFDKYNLNTSAIGGYRKEVNTMYINSRYDTPEKIKEYVNKTKGYFSNSSGFAPYLHELGHKQYEDALVVYAEKNNISVDKARNVIENKLMEYVGKKRKVDHCFIDTNISVYAAESYSNHKYSEIFAECLSAEKMNDAIKNTLKIMKGEVPEW